MFADWITTILQGAGASFLVGGEVADSIWGKDVLKTGFSGNQYVGGNPRQTGLYQGAYANKIPQTYKYKQHESPKFTEIAQFIGTALGAAAGSTSGISNINKKEDGEETVISTDGTDSGVGSIKGGGIVNPGVQPLTNPMQIGADNYTTPYDYKLPESPYYSTPENPYYGEGFNEFGDPIPTGKKGLKVKGKGNNGVKYIGKVTGKTHAQGGEKFVLNGKPVELEKGEKIYDYNGSKVVLNADQQAQLAKGTPMAEIVKSLPQYASKAQSGVTIPPDGFFMPSNGTEYSDSEMAELKKRGYNVNTKVFNELPAKDLSEWILNQQNFQNQQVPDKDSTLNSWLENEKKRLQLEGQIPQDNLDPNKTQTPVIEPLTPEIALSISNKAKDNIRGQVPGIDKVPTVATPQLSQPVVQLPSTLPGKRNPGEPINIIDPITYDPTTDKIENLTPRTIPTGSLDKYKKEKVKKPKTERDFLDDYIRSQKVRGITGSITSAAQGALAVIDYIENKKEAPPEEVPMIEPNFITPVLASPDRAIMNADQEANSLVKKMYEFGRPEMASSIIAQKSNAVNKIVSDIENLNAQIRNSFAGMNAQSVASTNQTNAQIQGGNIETKLKWDTIMSAAQQQNMQTIVDSGVGIGNVWDKVNNNIFSANVVRQLMSKGMSFEEAMMLMDNLA